jgi:hypothetical protein
MLAQYERCTDGVAKAISGSLISALALVFLMPRRTLQGAGFAALALGKAI